METLDRSVLLAIEKTGRTRGPVQPADLACGQVPVVNDIANGREGTFMAAWSPTLDAQQIQDVTEYIVVTFGN